MLNDKDFIDRVWNKYEIYSTKEKLKKNKFFAGNLYKNAHFMLVLKTCALSLMLIAFTAVLTGGAYAGVKYVVDKKNYEEKVIEKEEMDFVGYVTSLKAGALEYQDGIEYQIIDNYQKYLEVKKFVNIPDMSENDFNEYFLVFILPRYGRANLHIKDMETTEDTLKINVETREGSDNVFDEYIKLCTKISNDMKREKIEIVYLSNKPNMSNYADLNDIPYDYTKEQAIEDGCVILENGKFVTDKNGIKDFIDRTQNGINDNIRIVQYGGYYFLSEHEKNLDGAYIIDIEFKNGKYIVCQDYSRTISKEDTNENCDHLDKDFKIYNHKKYDIYDIFVCQYEEGPLLQDGSMANEEYFLGKKTNTSLYEYGGNYCILVKY